MFLIKKMTTWLVKYSGSSTTQLRWMKIGHGIFLYLAVSNYTDMQTIKYRGQVGPHNTLAGNMVMIDTSNRYMSIQPQNYNLRSTESNVEVLVDQPLDASRSEGNITENKTRQHISL